MLPEGAIASCIRCIPFMLDHDMLVRDGDRYRVSADYRHSTMSFHDPVNALEERLLGDRFQLCRWELRRLLDNDGWTSTDEAQTFASLRDKIYIPHGTLQYFQWLTHPQISVLQIVEIAAGTRVPHSQNNGYYACWIVMMEKHASHIVDTMHVPSSQKTDRWCATNLM